MSWLPLWKGLGAAAVASGIPSLCVRGRPGESRERMGDVPHAGERAPVWVHAASVGEIAAAASLLRALRRSTTCAVALSTTTSTGRQRAGSLAPDVGPFVAPFDAPGPVRRAVDRLQPACFLAVETEIWPTLLDDISRRGIPWALVSARISRRGHMRMRWVRGLYESVLRRAHAIAARSEEDAARFRDLGAPADRIAVLGDLKADVDVPPWAPPAASRPAWIAACTRPGEEAIALAALRAIGAEAPPVELVLAPRHPERFTDVAKLVEDAGFPLRPWRDRDRAPGGAISVLLVDEMGVLDEAYRRAACAFVGGSLEPFGGHNPWEAAAAGRPVIMGPHTEHCREAVETLRAAGGLVGIDAGADLPGALRRWLLDPAAAEAAGRAAREALARRGGVGDATVEFLRARGVLQ